jgi:hypothetical protein
MPLEEWRDLSGERSLVLLGPQELENPGEVGLPYEDVWFRTCDGVVMIQGRLMKNQRFSQLPSMLYFRDVVEHDLIEIKHASSYINSFSEYGSSLPGLILCTTSSVHVLQSFGELVQTNAIGESVRSAWNCAIRFSSAQRGEGAYVRIRTE